MTTRRWSILVVEDDALFLESLSMLLDEEGFDVVAAPSATEALRAASERHFDLIVTDVRMPGMDGIAMLDRVRRDSPQTRAIVITGYSEFQVPVEAVRVQVDDFLAKPFDRQAFLASVRRSLEWLEREAWWDGALRGTLDEASATLGWMLPRLQAPDPVVQERAHRLASLAATAARSLALPPDVARPLAWAASLVAPGHARGIDELQQYLDGPRDSARDAAGLAQEQSLHGMLAVAASLAREALAAAKATGASLAAVVPGAETPAPCERGLSPAATVLTAALCMEFPPIESASSDPAALRRLQEGGMAHRGALDAMEKAVAGAAEGPEGGGEAPSRSLLALGLGYLHAGRADVARHALSQALEAGTVTPSTALLTTVALAHASCGDAPPALDAAEQALALADTALEEAEAMAVRGAVRLVAGSRGGDDDLDEAIARCTLHGSRRGEIRGRLLLAWGLSRTPSRSRAKFDVALRRLLDEVEASRLDWALQRDRWLTLPVLRHARTAGVEAERAQRWLSRLDADTPADASADGGQDEAPATPILRMEALGRLRIRVGEREIREEDWKTTKSKWIFLVLLLHGGREVPDERIMDLFWEAQDADRARQNLYSTLTYVRRALSSGEALPEDPVIHRRGHCRFNMQVPHQVDFLAFDQVLRRGLSLWDAGSHAEAVPLLQEALELYQGDLLENYDETWVLPHRRSMRERAVLALEHLLAHYRSDGDVVAATATAERMLFVEHCHQGAYQCLMRAAAESGQPERVARLYRACVRALRDELHISPSPQTTAIYHGVLDMPGAMVEAFP